MGIGVVLLIWAVVGTILAAIGAAALGGTAGFFTRGLGSGRRTVILAASLFPFVCFGWAGVVFVFQAIINETVLHRDAGLGDTWRCPLPNGYALLMIDVTDYGWVYNPRTQSEGAVGEQEDAVAGVRLVQVAGRYILGGSDSHIPTDVKDSDRVDSYFLLDTQAGKRNEFAHYAQLRDAAGQLGIAVSLEPINTVYSRFRFTWFDVVVAIVFCVPPLLSAWLFLRRIVRMRRTRDLTMQHA